MSASPPFLLVATTAGGIVAAYVYVWLWIFREQKRALDERAQQDWQVLANAQAARQSRFSELFNKVQKTLARREALLRNRKASRRPFRRSGR